MNVMYNTMRCSCGNAGSRASNEPKPPRGKSKFGSVIVETLDNELHAGMDCRNCGAVYAIYGDQKVLEEHVRKQRAAEGMSGAL